ncbi:MULTISPECIES: NAD(P)-dependent oxidoreductase [unclassified Methylobacterium]|jgi:citronellol/citronellal dehydrogenase|uniref:SDR family oxidoreductase n=1 Tax=unclassified Methylobacterium TaxID=2615210 RepID=UPI0006FC1DAF|nr:MULTISPECIES: NAD(P)-dependent oxidoreductase [unclassified Methylobacterium]KQO67366.1 short-chain dehydrogenase [Methylobacterium sp. Leaf89]KQO74099.1 short-chain dehydrogenase [Methylobacterium sp. Leaf88]KQP54221.1 short-chain dehydrogenase [Methylobacterium sp. Leaf111]KQT84821.1 short-chain dehydrogenase [Methylobacterium sp. Leaf465]KQU35341.1 short-chain dehydrogenase [Methylobacterium sp. Leaf94]
MSDSLQGKTLFITGASRGIGLAIALRAARDGANIAIAAKTDAPHPKLAGTIHTAAAAIESAGGRALPLLVDVRDEDSVASAIARTAETFGGIDIVVNNASAIALTRTPETEMKRFDLMHGVNTRGTYMVSKYAIPHLAKAENPHIVMLSPPLDMAEKWFAPHLAYSIAKYGMSLCVLGLAGELKRQGIAVNALWPRTTIATAAVQNLLGGEALMQASRTPEILADAAHALFRLPARAVTGRFLIDDSFLAEQGVTDFSKYRVTPGIPLAPDFFVPDASTPPPGAFA